MKRISSLFIFILVILSGCDYFPKDDKHVEVPFFEDIIKDKTIFEPISIIDENKSDSQHLFFLTNGKYLSIKQSLEEIKNDNAHPNLKKDTDHHNILNIEIRDLNNNLNFKEIINSNAFGHIIVDKNANLYADGFYYSSPNYSKKIKMELINISDSLSARTLKNLSPNEDSVQNVNLAILEKKFDFKKKKDEDYIVKNDKVFVFINADFLIDNEQKQSSFDEFDDPILVEYRNDNRAFPSSYYYYYYNIGKIKVKYFDGKSGTVNPGKIEYGGQTYLIHPKFGIYKIKKS